MDSSTRALFRSNFCGLTCFGPLMLNDNPADFFDERGYYMQNQYSHKYQLVDSDVLCVISRPNDDEASRSAVLMNGFGGNAQYCLPPGTLLRLVGVEGPPFHAEFRVWQTWTDEEGLEVFMDRRSLNSLGQAQVNALRCDAHTKHRLEPFWQHLAPAHP